jgi:hypothetical protein
MPSGVYERHPNNGPSRVRQPKRMPEQAASAEDLLATAKHLEGVTVLVFPLYMAERLRGLLQQQREQAQRARKILTALETGRGSRELHAELRQLLAQIAFAGRVTE